MNRYTQPDFTTSALITIDTQVDTLDGQPLEIPGTSAILPNMQRLLAMFRDCRLPIVHLVRLYQADGSNVDLCRKESVEQGHRAFAPGTPGAELAPGLLPGGLRLDSERLLAGNAQIVSDREIILYKPRWGAFYQTNLEKRLRQWSIGTTVFSGCNFPNCPRASIVEASERDFRVVAVADAVSGLDERGQREMANIGVAVLSTDEVLAGFARAPMDSR